MSIEMNRKRRVILVTDGDKIAQEAVEVAARKVSCRCISASAGNPTPLTGKQVIEYIKMTPSDPVVVMVDDRGLASKGKGETVMEDVIKHPDLEIIGVVAVASNTENINGARVDCVVTKEKQVLTGQVDKDGNPISTQAVVRGDTVDILNGLNDKIPYIVGIGDIGKMEDRDKAEDGAQVTTKALQLILENWQGREN